MVLSGRDHPQHDGAGTSEQQYGRASKRTRTTGAPNHQNYQNYQDHTSSLLPSSTATAPSTTPTTSRQSADCSMQPGHAGPWSKGDSAAPFANKTEGDGAGAATPGPVAAAVATGADGAAATPAAAGAAGGAKGAQGKGMGKGRAILPAAQAAQAAADAEKKLKDEAANLALAAAAAAAGGVPTANGYMRPREVKHPLDIGGRVLVKRKDGQALTCKIIERRQKPGTIPSAADSWDYYVHYVGFNRRMDEWVVLEQLDLSTVEVEIPDPDPKKKKKVVMDEHDSDSDHGDFDPNALREHEEFTKVKNIESIELGRHEMETWYFSPFPPEYKDCKKLYFCEYTLQFFKRRSQMLRHMRKTVVRHPPGEEFYRNGNVCMFEVDGKREKAFCQNLCFLAKLFLDHKTLYYDVDLFLFYVLCEIDERGAHVVGYFSKEKCSEEGYNLACILSLPAWQRKGYGKFLISMSYELSKIEGKVGTPERPLSDLGRTAYHGYWTRELLKIIRDHDGTISIKELGERTAIRSEDVINTLQQLGMVQLQKGQHVICAAPKLVEHHLKQAGGPGLVVDPTKIVWTPYNAEREYKDVKA